MPSKSYPDAPAPADHIDGISPPEHIRLLGELRGHTGYITRAAWSPDGKVLASTSRDDLCRLWDPRTRQLLGEIPVPGSTADRDFSWSPEGSQLAICYTNGLAVVDSKTQRQIWAVPVTNLDGVAWSPQGDVIAAGAADGIVRLFAASDGGVKALLSDHRGSAFSLAWSDDGRYLATGGGGSVGEENDCGIRIWEIPSANLVHVLQGHSGYVADLAWSGNRLASVSMDTTVKVWHDAESPSVHGSITNIEVHTGETRGVAFSPDGRVLVSHSWDNSARFWRTDEFHQIGAITFHKVSDQLYDRVAFSPDGRTLALVRGKVILLFEVDPEGMLRGAGEPESLRYTTAKLVLVGDSGVGKTGLGWRLSHGEWKEHESTHGQQFWIVDSLRTRREDGTECEAVLWDLAGQHVYRPVHAIFLEGVAAALILFDPTNRQESLKGVEFWIDQLAGKGLPPPAVLVGARLDRGSPVLSRDDLDQFCRQRNITGGYIGTSARSGEGMHALVSMLRQIIPWNEAAATVTTATFKRIKDYVLALKEDPARADLLLSTAQLQQKLAASDANWRFTPEEMMTAVGHLENHGYVAVLHNSAGQKSILLLPMLLPGLASSIILEADRHPRELGAVNETLLLKGGYQFPELANLRTAEKETLVDSTVVRLLSHNICFRETLGSETLLIFPSLIKQKRPLVDEVETVDGVSYVVRGRVENLYSGLVVLLGYTHAFTRVTKWQNQVQYEFEKGQVCGFRMYQDREGEMEFVLYHSPSTPEYGRTLFQGLFEKFLYERDVTVSRFNPVVCPNAHAQDRAALVQRRREGKQFVFCGECGMKIILTDADTNPGFSARISSQVDRQKALARLRSSYEANLARIKAYRRDRTPPRCYLSFSGDKTPWIAELARNLLDAGVNVLASREQLVGSDFVLRVNGTQVALNGYTADFRDDTRYALSLFDLVLTLYAIGLAHPAFAGMRQALDEQWKRTFGANAPASPSEEVFVSYAWEPESETILKELDTALQKQGIRLVRDKRDLGFKGEIRAFMERIGRGKCVVVVLSEKYLQSENCLFELLQISKHGEFADRIFPIVTSSARIYKPLDRIRYVQYWEKQLAELDAAMKTVSSANLQGFREEIDLYAEIRAALPRLAEILKNLNALSPDIHRQSGFAQLIGKVCERLDS